MTAPESRADVELTRAERRQAAYATVTGADMYDEAAVERILADRLAAVRAEARESRRLMMNAEGVAAGEEYLRGEAEAALADALANTPSCEALQTCRAIGRAESAEAERDRNHEWWTAETNRSHAAEAERDRLQRWKDEALPVIAGLQELGRALGLRLGESITGPEAAKAAEAMRAERDGLRALRLAVEAPFSDHWFHDGGNVCECGYWAEFDSVKRHHLEDALRAALASPSSLAQRDAEVGARCAWGLRGLPACQLGIRDPWHWCDHCRARADALAAEAGGES
jgi:hypothetical protein